MRNYTGINFKRGRDIAEVAKLVRADLKKAVKKGELPKGFKASVRISRYSMGQSLDIEIQACPGVSVLNRRRMLLDLRGEHATTMTRPISDIRIPSDEGAAVIEFIDGIRNSYGYDRSGHEPDDYSNCLFYGDTKFSYAMETAEREAFARECAALTAPDMAELAAAGKRAVEDIERDRERAKRYEERREARKAARKAAKEAQPSA